MIIVLDTNVLVSGLLTPFGPPGRLVDQIVAMNVQVAFDDRIIDEYKSVLRRPKFQFNEQDIDAFIDHVTSYGIHVSATPLGSRNVPDPSDLPFAEVAVGANVDALVTGDKGHFDFLDSYRIAVVTPSELMQIIEGLTGE